MDWLGKSHIFLWLFFIDYQRDKKYLYKKIKIIYFLLAITYIIYIFAV